MSAHNARKEMADPQYGELVDPGADGDISPTLANLVCPVVTAAAESRTLKDPEGPGILFMIHFLTDGGDLTVDADSPINSTGNTRAVLADAGDSLTFFSTRDGTDSYRWNLINNDGGTLSTP